MSGVSTSPKSMRTHKRESSSPRVLVEATVGTLPENIASCSTEVFNTLDVANKFLKTTS